MSLKDLRDISDIRKLLECKALSKSIEIGDVDWEARVVAAYHKLSTIESSLREGPATPELTHEWSKANEAFHEALISACGNSWLFRLRKILHDQSQRYIRFSLINAGTSRNVHEEHCTIFQAAIARDAPRACELICQHIDNTVQVITDLVSDKIAES
jgi:DNA-binding GntR family transcriptional regulator